MSDVFPKWTNKLPLYLGLTVAVIGASAVAGVWYYFTPKYTRVGYQPLQPVAFSHSVHSEQLGIDCRYCHDGVESSWFSNVPAASTCMNCHKAILADDDRLAPVRASLESGDSIPWVQIHKKPDYVYFNHAVHVNRGVSCVECHGQVNQMEEVYHAKPFSMGFCLECHRNPESHLRDPDEVYDLNYRVDALKQEELGEKYVHDWNVNASQNCSACHR